MTNADNSERKEVLADLVGFEVSKLKNTVRDLTTKPGIAITDYAQGDRKRYLSPITYFLLIFGISFFADTVTGVADYIFDRSFNQWGDSFAAEMREAEKDSGGKMPFDVQKLSDEVDSEISALFRRKETQLLILLPGLLLCQWIFFRRSKSSFLHNSYFALFILGHYTLLLLPVTFLYFISEDLFFYTYMVLGFIFPIVFNIYSGVNFYAADWKRLVVRNIFLYISVVVIASIVSGFLGMAVAIITSLTSIFS